MVEVGGGERGADREISDAACVGAGEGMVNCIDVGG